MNEYLSTVDGELYRNLFTIGDLHREEVARMTGVDSEGVENGNDNKMSMPYIKHISLRQDGNKTNFHKQFTLLKGCTRQLVGKFFAILSKRTKERRQVVLKCSSELQLLYSVTYRNHLNIMGH
ncbi:hypothetical protein E5288_WYG018648 [Bos mutus]|uniref:Uncharacterized protein n=1 Tax=Bos mutus TaxID=72004 RepID=A0A6B0R6Q0_9CETA|nr:hypothetical protein [Bos mutus]